MSYSLTAPCNFCEKKDLCKDSETILKGIREIHQSTDGSHLGSGQVILSCNKMVSTFK